MGISSILNIAKSGIFASQTALSTISHNVANVDTEGYSRQEAVLETATPVPSGLGLSGNGVTVSQIKSYNDKFLEKRIIDKNSDLQYQQTISNAFQEIESVLSEDNSSLSDYMTSFYNAWSELSADPTSESARTSLYSAGDNLSRTIRNIYQELKNMQIEANNNVEQTIDDINGLTARIADLNQKIFTSESGSGTANDYVDERTELLKELAGKLDIQTVQNDDGQVTVMTSSGKLLLDGAQFYNLRATIDEGASFYGISREGPTGDLFDITGDINGGSLKGHLDIRDTYIPEFMQDMDEMAQGLIENVNYFHSQGTNLNGNTNITFFEELEGNYAKDIDLSDAVKSSVRNIAAGTSTGGNNDIALKIASLGEEDIIYGTAKSESFPDTSAQLGITGTLVINGQKITIVQDDTVESIRSKINALPDVSAQIVSNRLVLQSTGGRSTITLSDGSTLADGSIDSSSNLLGSLAFTSGGSSFTSYIANGQAKVGNYTQSAQDSAEYESDTMEALKSRRESVSGVSLDEELSSMLRYQYAYQAAAKLITLADEMFQTLLEM